MGQRVIPCDVLNEYITGAGVVVGAAGSHDEVLLELDFRAADSVWAGTTRVVTFRDALSQNPVDIILGVDLLSEGHTDVYLVPIPARAKAIEGEMRMTIRGVIVQGDKELVRVVTKTALFRILPSELNIYDENTDVPASAAEQLQHQIDTLKSDLIAQADRAEAAKQDAETARDEAQTAESEAKEAQSKAEVAQGKAEDAQAGAESAKDNAEEALSKAKEAQTKAETARTGAETAQNAAEDSASRAAASQEAAARSEANAKTSESNAKTSETNAKTSETNAKTSEGKAKTSENNAKDSETNAKTSESNAKTSETKAKASEDEAKRLAETFDTEALYARIKSKGDNLEFDMETSLLWLTSDGKRVGAGIKVSDDDVTAENIVAALGYTPANQEDVDRLSNEKADQVYVIPEDYGAKGDGSTDDSAAIQAAIDAAGSVSVVYLAAKKYNIATSLTLTGSYKTLICDGWLVYSGTGAAITVKNAYRCKMQINTIDAANGTALKLDATEGAVYSNDFTVDVIRNSNIGIHLYTNGSHISHNTLRNTYMTAKETAIKVWADSYYINENLWYLDWVGGTWTTGIHLYSASSLSNLAGLGVNDNKFYSGSLEGTNAKSIPLLIEQSWGNYFKELRCAEGYGSTSVKIVGKCTRNDISLNHLTLSEVDISEIGSGSVHNVLRCRGTNSDTTNFFIVGDEVRLSAVHGFTYWPDRYDYNVNVNSETFAGNVITQVGTAIPTALTFQSGSVDGKTFVIGAIYSESGSMARGFPLSVRFGDGVGHVLLNDNKGNRIIDNRTGKYDGKVMSVRWDGFHNGMNQNIWAVQEIGGSVGTVDVTNLSQNVGFASDEYGVVLESEGGNKYRIITTDGGLLTTVEAADVNQVPLSVDADNSIFNGTGYQNEKRISSGGEVKDAPNGTVTGFIPVKAGETVRFSGGNWNYTMATNCVNYFNSAKSTLGYFTSSGDYGGIFTAPGVVTVLDDGMYQIAVPHNQNIVYMRLSMYDPNGAPGENLVVYVDGEKVQTPIVESVNGKTGAVNLAASDVGALPANTKIPSKTSDLTNDSGYITGYTETDPTVPAWAKATTKPSYTKSEVGLGNVDNVKQYSSSNPPPYPVASVNGKTGAVNLTASDVGARPSSWTPTASEVGALAASGYTTKALTVTYADGTSETVTLVVSK